MVRARLALVAGASAFGSGLIHAAGGWFCTLSTLWHRSRRQLSILQMIIPQSRPTAKSNNSNPSALLVRSDCSLKNRLCPLEHGAQITQTYNSSLFLLKQ